MKLDINECLLRNGHGPCQDTCINSFGGYNCTCNGLPGTRLSDDQHGCEDAGECSFDNGGCSHKCLTTLGRKFCLCPDGFILSDDWKTCQGNFLLSIFIFSFLLISLSFLRNTNMLWGSLISNVVWGSSGLGFVVVLFHCYPVDSI